MKNLLTILVVLFPLLVAWARADDFTKERLDNWHQWRGPLANGTAPHGKPPVKWDDKTNIKWKTPLPGLGSSTPIVWGDLVFVLTAIDTGREADPADIPKANPQFQKRTKPPTTYHQFVVLAVDRNNGKIRWKRVAAEAVPHEGHHATHTYAAFSPTTDGKLLFVSFGSRGLYCYDFEGNLKWKRTDLPRLETRLGWGEAASPALHGDALIVPWDQEGPSHLYVLDKKTGQTRWKVDRDEVTTWNTPLVVDYKGRTQIIVPATKYIRSYDLADGRVLWKCGGLTVNCIPSAVRYGDSVICMSGYRGAAAFRIALDSQGDITGTDKILWTYKRGTPYVPSPLLTGDRLYFTQTNEPLLTCLNAKTGAVVMDRERLRALRSLYGSPVEADGRIYLTDRDGTTVVLQRGDTLKVLSVNRLNEPIDASPVVVGKQLFLRGARHLYCIEGE
ncbi:MAG TPA: PQQ-binding-like beta-propeller repeat protein [Gemmataceae bacterium]|nr:PQQ-binding-like beta-propeller repeat protein [Gemmataceae bacterium]